MLDHIPCQVMERTLEQGIGKYHQPAGIGLDTDLPDIDPGTGMEEDIVHILPVRGSGTKVLVQLRELDILADIPDKALEFFHIHGIVRLRRPVLHQIEVSSHNGELVPDIVPGNLCKQVELPVCQPERILCHLDLRDVMQDLHHILSPAEIDECRAGKDRDLPPFPVNNLKMLQPGPFEEDMLKPGGAGIV